MKSKKFESEYFRGWFKKAVGDFTKKDLEISRNWFWAWLKELNKYIPIEKGNGRSALEIGCSIGGAASLLAECGFEVCASDISKYAVKRAKRLSSNIDFLVFDVQKKIPLQKKFDIVYAFEVVEHLEKPKVAIRNMYDQLKKDGYLILSSPYPYSWIYEDPTHINVKHPNEWIKIMINVGLKEVTCRRFSLLPFFYRFNKRFHIIFPFAIPLRLINSPIFFIGKK